MTSMTEHNPFIEHPAEHNSILDGDQWKFTFANGYGASVIRHMGSYGHESGKWELAVIGPDGRLSYDTPITNDVIGWLDEAEVRELLRKIAELPVSS